MDSKYWHTTLEKFKRFYNLEGTEDDALICELIDSASTFIESYCGNRKFKEREYTNYFDGQGHRFLYLEHYPITQLIKVEENGVELTDCEMDDNKIAIRRSESQIFAKGVRNIKVQYKAGFATIPADIELACNMLVGFYFRKHEEHSVGLTSQSSAGGTVSYYPADIPNEILRLINKYRKI